MVVTKWIGLEGTSIIAKEKEEFLKSRLSPSFVEEAKEYKEHVKYNGTKSETRFKTSSNNKRTVKISHKKRESARNTKKQNIQQYYDKEQ